ncbi:MAG: hypothetical protein ACFFDP_09005 [Promethearchaeota archaeon]
MAKNPDWMAGFQACLDLMRHRLADADTLEEVMQVLEGIESAFKEKQVEQIIQELAIL